MSVLDLGQIHVEGLIVHEIPQHFVHAQTNADPVLSDIESTTDQIVRNFFRERMAHTLGRHAYEVDFNTAASSPVPELVVDLLRKRSSDFVAASQEMALHLHNCQGGASPGGLLTVIRGTVEGRAAIAVMKLEKDEGTRVKRDKIGGHQSFNVTHIRDLMLTKKTRVFKVGLFGIATDGKIRGLVCDKQGIGTTTVAYFFLQTFLGCILVETPELTTQRSWEVAQQFINEDVDDPEVKGRYQAALAVEMNANRTSVSLEDFADNYFNEGDRASFIEREQAAGVPTTSFPKDTKLIEPQLRRVQWSFQNDISVIAGPEAVGNQLNVEQLSDGRTRLEVLDNLKDVKGHR
jgi:hypothetical protein